MEGQGAGGGNRVEGWGRRVSVHLMLLTSRTTRNIGADKQSETWPSKVGGNKLASFEEARVPGSRVVVAATKDVAMEVIIGGNVNATLIGKYPIGMLPIREAEWKAGGMEPSMD